MRLGFSIPNNQGVARVSDLVDLAIGAEQLGYGSVWVSEHLFHASYVASRLGDAPYHEPLTVLAAIASATERVRLGTSVLVLPWHHPVRLAKIVASLDDLSGGRVTLGVGVANAEDEYGNLGIPFGERGRIANEMLQAMKVLWAEEFPRHEGRYFSFSELRFEPKPIQRPHPEILVGGASEPAYRRVVQHGDGWHPLSLSANEVHKGMDRIAALCADAGRDSSTIAVAPRLMTEVMDAPWERPVTERRSLRGTMDEIAAMLEAYSHHGVREVVIDANSRDLDDTRRLMREMARFIDV